MKTRKISSVILNQTQLAKDLETLAKFDMSDIYDEFVCGGNLKSCMLWNSSGDVRDNELVTYDGHAKLTEHGLSLPYINQLITDNFNLSHLKFARILLLKPNSVFMPHRDYLELKRDLLRFHLPIKTDMFCFNSENEIVFHMNPGDIWYINASKIHSAASFSSDNRIHVVLDFEFADFSKICLKKLNNINEIPLDSIIKRNTITKDDVEILYDLHKIIDESNFYDVFSIVIKKYFYSDINAFTVYIWLNEIASLSKNDEVIKKAKYWESHCLHKR